MTKCKWCGEKITWIRTPKNRMMPCNLPSVRVRQAPDGPLNIVRIDGNVVRCEAAGRHASDAFDGYIPHWATCKGGRP